MGHSENNILRISRTRLDLEYSSPMFNRHVSLEEYKTTKTESTDLQLFELCASGILAECMSCTMVRIEIGGRFLNPVHTKG